MSTLFLVAFVKMEVRRMGYQVWKQSREVKQVSDVYRLQSIQYARLTRPEHIETYAHEHLALNRPMQGQIIQVSQLGTVVRY